MINIPMNFHLGLWSRLLLLRDDEVVVHATTATVMMREWRLRSDRLSLGHRRLGWITTPSDRSIWINVFITTTKAASAPPRIHRLDLLPACAAESTIRTPRLLFLSRHTHLLLWWLLHWLRRETN